MNQAQKDVWKRLMEGTVDLDDPMVIAMEGQSAAFAREVAQLRQTQLEIMQATQEMDSILEEAKNAPILESDRRLLQSIPQVAPTTHGATVRHARFRWIGMAAALLLAVIGFAWYQGLGPTEDQPVGPALGNQGALKLTYPVNSPAAFDHFAWEGELEFGCWFIVRVLDLDTNEVFSSEILYTNQWTPKNPIQSRRIRWHVEVFTPSGGAPSLSASQEVWL